ncbi:MAG: T9SS C-terminal target domain-containing protein [Bacteroidales bacterium]|nr:MAG: T9SS C-terminal target domain-containing protein [Bacteroidales bacterium]
MKKLYISFALLVAAISVFAQTPNISMTTTLSINSQISFTIRGNSSSTPIQIDWGNGVKVSYTIGDMDEAFNFPVKGSNIKIWGQGVEGFNIQSKELTAMEFYQATSFKTLFCKNNQLTTLNLSDCSALTLVECKQNFISSLTLPSTATLTYVDCSDNNLTLATLPLKQASWTDYIYTPQKDYTLAKTVYSVNEEIDLSNQLTINSNTTIFTWKAASGATLVNGTDYSVTGGKFTFLKTYSESLYCEMSNATFPSLTLKTISITIPPLPAVVMTTTTAIGSTFSFTIAATASNTPIQVDWGNGILTNYIISIGESTPSSTITGSTIKIYGIGIAKLLLYSNNLTDLDITRVLELRELTCYSNQLSSLDVSKNIALTILLCNSNQLSILDISKNIELEQFWCHSNQLISLDVSKNTKLKSLLCNNNNLTTLDISKNINLISLWCYGNAITSLNIQNNTALENLICAGNPISNLDVSNNIALKELWCESNRLTSLNLSKNIALTSLRCLVNNLTTLDVSKNIMLKVLWCNSNLLSTLDVSKNTALTDINCEGNQITALDVSKNTEITNLDCESNKLTALDVSKNTGLTKLICSYNQLATLDVSKNIALATLWFDYNQLTTLDVTGNTVLTNLNCESNKLTSLDVTQNNSLTQLLCSFNKLTTLDVSKNTALTSLYCYSNQLTALDVTKNTALTTFSGSSNRLAALDLSMNTALTYVDCKSNLFNFVTLPIKQTAWTTYTYSPQTAMVLPKKNYALSETIDLSSQITANGNTTSYIWKTKGGTTLTSGTDYSVTNGITTFLKVQTDSVYCQMTNATFPSLTLSTTNVKVTQFPTSIDEVSLAINIYPNPVKESLNIELNEIITKVEVYTVLGAKVYEKHGDNTLTMVIPAADFPKGLLIVKVYGANGVMEKKILKE